jgi:hypothetical protein
MSQFSIPSPAAPRTANLLVSNDTASSVVSFQEEVGNFTGSMEEESAFASVEIGAEDHRDYTSTTTQDQLDSKEMIPELVTPAPAPSGSSEDTEHDTEMTEEIEQPSPRKTIPLLLHFYFTAILSNCLALPIFLGLVASKASKFEARGKNLLDENTY